MGERHNTRGSSQHHLPGAKAALVAFVLTVLLGIGATAAAGLWQQSATVTLAVSAAADWPAAAMSLHCTAGPGDSVTVTIQNIPAPTAVTIASRTSGGTYGPSVTVSPASATLVVGATSYGIPDSVGSTKNSKVDLRVGATYTDGTGTAELLGLQLTGNNTKLACQ